MDFWRFCYPNIPCLRINIALIFVSFSSKEFTHEFLVCNHLTRRPCWGLKQKNVSSQNLHENRVQFPEERNAFVLDHQHGRRDVTCKQISRKTQKQMFMLVCGGHIVPLKAHKHGDPIQSFMFINLGNTFFRLSPI